MAAPNRVEELRKRYHENPRRFFAPLANEYRKTGFPDRAILLCEKHLSEQPDNLNGLVVYGQTLFESGRRADAKQPFEMALKLDQENLIALRHLGDIAKEEGDNDGARRWYERVLEFDRRNEEVLDLLESVGGPTEKEPPSGPSSAPNIVNVASSVRVTTSGADDPSAIGMIDLDAPEPVMEAPIAEAPSGPSAPRPRAPTPAAKTVEVSAPAKPAKRGSLMDIAFDFGEVASPAAAASASPPAAPPRALEDMPTLVTESAMPRHPAPVMPIESLIEQAPEPESLGGVGRIEGLEAAEYESDAAPLADLEPSEFEAEDVAPLADLEAGAFIGLGTDQPDPMAGLPELGSAEDDLPAPAELELPSIDLDEPSAPRAKEPDFGGTIAFSASRLEELGPPPAPRPTDGLPLLDPIEDAEPMPVPEPGPVAEPASAPTPFVTETMAELYLKQGHREEAMDVYRQLIAQSPRDESLREKLAKLEAAGRMSLEFETPSAVELVEPTPAPANAMLADVSFADVALATPARSTAPLRSPTPPRVAAAPPAAAPPAAAAPVPNATAPAGPTAREYLGAFAKRGFTPLSSPVIPATPTATHTATPTATPTPTPTPSAVPGGGLDLVFGASVAPDDDRAAHRLAGVGATSGPSGGTALDSLFGEGPSAPMPAELAQGRGVQRASDKLRFDQFFTTPPEDAVPIAEASSAPSAPMPEVEEGASAPPGEDDDLDQFQGWLRGLTS